jgi:transcriptional regulator with XRE-family HTH domain
MQCTLWFAIHVYYSIKVVLKMQALVTNFANHSCQNRDNYHAIPPDILKHDRRHFSLFTSNLTTMNTFAQHVRDRRLQENLSQEELAQKVGISRNYLSQIERGQANNLSWQVREKLSAILGLKDDLEAETHDPDIPSSLATFAQSAKLPPDDVAMLARLKYRGKQPTTPEKWELLYNVIKMTVGQ